jgi:hypothetical protein
MKKSLIVLALVLLAGCYRTERTGIMHEDASVEDTIFQPSQHGSGTAYDLTGKGGLSVTSVDIPEKYALIFKCQHGKFVIQGTGERYKALWKRLSKGQKVDVSYQEVYRVYKSDDGKQPGRVLEKYDFLDATVKE